MVAAAPRKKPGPKEGTPKALKRTLDREFPERLRKAMAEYKDGGIEVPELARAIKCTRAVLIKYRNLATPPKSAEPLLVLTICKFLGIRIQWLLTKEGEMREPPPTPKPQFSQSALNAAKFVDKLAPEKRSGAVMHFMLTYADQVSDKDVPKVWDASEKQAANKNVARSTKRSKPAGPLPLFDEGLGEEEDE